MTKNLRRILIILGVLFVFSGLLQLLLALRAAQDPSPQKLVPDSFGFLVGVPWTVGICALGVLGGLGLIFRLRPGWIMAILFCIASLFSQFVTIGARVAGAVDGTFAWPTTLFRSAIWIGMLLFLVSAPVRKSFLESIGGNQGTAKNKQAKKKQPKKKKGKKKKGRKK